MSRSEIFVLGPAGVRSGRRGNVVDVYSAHDGSYRYSFVLPDSGLGRMDVTPHEILTVGDTTVTRWRR